VCAKRARRATAHIAIGAEDKLNADCFESNEILPSIRETNPQIKKEARPFSGRYDFLWFFRTALATNRGRAADHRLDPTPGVCCIRGFD